MKEEVEEDEYKITYDPDDADLILFNVKKYNVYGYSLKYNENTNTKWKTCCGYKSHTIVI